MRILKKVLWIWVFVLAFSLFNCVYDDCNCPKYDRELAFFAFTNEASSYNLVRRASNPYSRESNDTTIFFQFDYWGFGLNYDIQTTAQNNNRNKPIDFSIIPSAYACECDGRIINYQMKNVYPISFKVYNIYPVNDSTRETRLINDLFVIKGDGNLKMKNDNIHIDTNLLLSEQQILHEDRFEVQFLLNYNLIDSDSLKFRIETELNTGEILTTETPLVRFQN